jgi:hypothetical protein
MITNETRRDTRACSSLLIQVQASGLDVLAIIDRISTDLQKKQDEEDLRKLPDNISCGVVFTNVVVPDL